MNYDYYLYDIILDDYKNIAVNLYGASVVTIEENGNKRSKNVLNLVDTIYPGDLCECINDLKMKGYISYQKLSNEWSNIFVSNPLINAKILFMQKNNKLLEKIYDFVVVNNTVYLYTYITYVNYVNGKIFALKTGNFNISFSDDLAEKLGNSGYVSIGASYLAKYLVNLDSTVNKPMELKRTKN